MRTWALSAAVLLVACGNPQREPSRLASLSGAVRVPDDARGDAYVYLYARGEGPPENLANPRAVSGVSDVERGEGDPRYLFAEVPPNPYRVWSFLDVDRNFDGATDVLSQPGAGDRVSEGIELNLQPGDRAELDLAPSALVQLEPPALVIDGVDGGALELPDAPSGVVSFALQADPLGVLDAQRLGFAVSLIDRDRDSSPDDENGDGVPELYPRTFLRWLPRPGQTLSGVPEDFDGDVLLPLVFDPGPFLTLLGGDPEQVAVVDRLNVFLLPQAQILVTRPGAGDRVLALQAIPPGDYELLVIQESGQFWRLPNGLGAAHPSQAFRFSVVRQ